MVGSAVKRFEILEKLGEGGMGVVYKARDTRLDRPVALKFLPAEKGPDPQSRDRFAHEARAASALNHPNIITVYDTGEHNGSVYIAMEYVRGRALADLIPRKGLPISETLRYAVQIADALSAAHDAGIVHRDLKPGNVMVTEKGLVKVLDFGLAKTAEAAPTARSDATLTQVAVTEPGIVIGTPAYMAPEQVEGRPVDARADVFSFGALLYEMVSGRQTFHKASQASTMAAVLMEEPAPLPPSVPRDLEKIIVRCLRKDPARRFQSIADVKVELEELKEDNESGKLAAVPMQRDVRPWWLWAFGATLAALLLTVGAVLAWRMLAQVPVDPKPVAFTAYRGFESRPAFSPDGGKVAFVWTGDNDDNQDIYVKQVGSTGPPMRLTSRPEQELSPAWAPDDRWIAFQRLRSDGMAIVLVPPLGGLERVVDVRRNGLLGLAWTPDSKWLIYADREPPDDFYSLWAISIDNAERRRVTNPHITGKSYGGFALGDTGPAVAPDGSAIAFARGVSGFVTELWAVPSAGGLRPTGEATKVVEERYTRLFGIAWNGKRELVYAGRGQGSVGLWQVRLSGHRVPRPLSFAGPGAMWPAVSTAARRLVYDWSITNVNIWRFDGRTSETRMLVASSYVSERPHYSPDGTKIAFQSNRSGASEIWACKSDGADCVQLTFFGGPLCGYPRWSPDSRWLVFDARAAGQSDVYVMPADGGAPRALTTDPAADYVPAWSHDGRWIYFISDRGGQPDIWRVPAAGGTAAAVTHTGADWAVTSPDGRYLYYTKPNSTRGPLFRVPVSGGPEEEVLPEVAASGCAFAANEAWCLAPDRKSIHVYDVSTRKSRSVASLPERVGFLDVSPDGRYVVWDQTDRVTEDLMLVENFR